MSEWISVKDRLPEYEDSYFVYRPEEDPPYLVSTFEGGEWRPDVGDDALDGVCYWCPLPPRPEPQLTVKEALAKAIAYIELCGLIGPVTDKLTAEPLLPRLRAALEAE